MADEAAISSGQITGPARSERGGRASRGGASGGRRGSCKTIYTRCCRPAASRGREITQRFRPASVIALGYLVIGLGFGLGVFAHSIAAFALCIGVFTLGEMCAMPVSSAFVAGLAPPHLRGRYMGTYGLTWTLAQVIGPGLGLALFAATPAGFWLVGGAIGVVSAAVAFAGRAVAAPGT